MIRRPVAVLVVLLVGSAMDAAAPPRQVSEEMPPFLLRLRGDDAAKAVELVRRIARDESDDRYGDAVVAAEELLALRKRVQGADHHATIDRLWELDRLRRLAALPPEQRRRWREAFAGKVQARELLNQGRDREAVPLLQTFADCCVELLGDRHPVTAAAYLNLANILTKQGELDEARRLYHRTVAIHRRLFGDRHPDTATGLNNLANNLTARGELEQAEPLFAKALAIRRLVLGEWHRDTAAGCNNLAYNIASQARNLEAQPLYQRGLTINRRVLGEGHLLTAQCYNNLASNLQAMGKVGEAEPLFRLALDIHLRVRGERHPETASCQNNLALNFVQQGKFAQAEPLYRQALETCRRFLGDEHPQTANAYSNLACDLGAMGMHDEAQPLFLESLAVRRRLFGEDHPSTATSYTGLSVNLSAMGRHAEAQPLYRQAVNIHRRVLGERHPNTASGYHHLAANLAAQGKHGEAEPLFRLALQIRRDVLGEQHPDVIRSLTGLATNLGTQGKHAEAQPLHRRALELALGQFGEHHPLTMEVYSHLAQQLADQRDHAGAALLNRTLVDIRRRELGEQHPDTAVAMNNLAANLGATGKHQEAEALYRAALESLGQAYGETHPRLAVTYFNLGLGLTAQGRTEAARVALEAAARSHEMARVAAATRGLDRAVFGGGRSPYPLLAVLLARQARPEAAWDALESDLGRGLADEERSPGGGNAADPMPKIRQNLARRIAALQQRILPLVARPQRNATQQTRLNELLELRRTLEERLASMAVAASRRDVVSVKTIQQALTADAALVAWIDVLDQSGGVQEHWGCVLRSTGEPHWVALAGTGPGGKWLEQDSSLIARTRRALADSSASVADTRDLGKALEMQRLVPLEPYLQGVRHLYVVPAGAMAGLPVSALTRKYIVSYIPSGSQWVRLHEHTRQSAPVRLLALGDPVFDSPEEPRPNTEPPDHGLLIAEVRPVGNARRGGLRPGDVLLTYADQKLTTPDSLVPLSDEEQVSVEVWRDGTRLRLTVGPGPLGVEFDPRPLREAIAAARETDRLLRAVTRGADLPPLPGTRREIEALSELFPARELLLGSDASEGRLDAMLVENRLGRFSHLHFATHGLADDSRSLETSLVLAQDHVPDNADRVAKGLRPLDGRLTAREVLENWKLNADLVVLSACESGLGRQGGGDGLLGFAQAFQLAGARSVVLGLWQVDDTATALLMRRFYQNLLGKRDGMTEPMSRSAALQEARHWLRELTRDEVDVEERGLPRGKPRSKPAAAATTAKPFAHPRYWAAFILVGDPG